MAGYQWASRSSTAAPHSGWTSQFANRQAQTAPVGAAAATDPKSVFYQLAYSQYANDPNMLANLQSASFSTGGFERLPGATDQEKATYLLQYLTAGAKQGLSAYDMIAGQHDSDLANARPKVGGQVITDPAAAAARLGSSGGYDLIKGNVARDQAAGYTNPAYANFWSKYGVSAPAQAGAQAQQPAVLPQASAAMPAFYNPNSQPTSTMQTQPAAQAPAAAQQQVAYTPWRPQYA